jgi:hypothetical protein
LCGLGATEPRKNLSTLQIFTWILIEDENILAAQKNNDHPIAPKEIEEPQVSLMLRHQELAIDKPDRGHGGAPSRMLEGLYCGLPHYHEADSPAAHDLPQTFEVHIPPALHNHGVSCESMCYSYDYGCCAP